MSASAGVLACSVSGSGERLDQLTQGTFDRSKASGGERGESGSRRLSVALLDGKESWRFAALVASGGRGVTRQVVENRISM